MNHWLDIVGVGERGVAELPPALRDMVERATTVIGPARHLEGLPPLPASPTRGEVPAGSWGDMVPMPQDGEGVGAERGADFPTPTLDPSPQGGGRRLTEQFTDSSVSAHPSPFEGGDGDGGRAARELIAWQPSLDAMLAQLLALRGTPTVMLATGDPMWFGFGATLARHIGLEEFAVFPHASSLQLAASRLRWPLQHVATISLHARLVEHLHPHVLPGNRILALTTDAATITHVVALLVARGYGPSVVTVLENLGGADERITSAPASAFSEPVGDFHVLAIDCVAGPGAALLPASPGLPDEAFVSDGQLTKREVRAATLAKLAPYPGALLWDVGAGCGSIGIEWMRAVRDARAIAFEREGERLQMIAVNAAALGVPGLRIENGEAPQSLAGMPAPDAVFLGGGVGDEALFAACWAALKPGGRLVANAVTVDGEQALFARHAAFGGEISRIDVSSLDVIGSHRVMRPRMAVTQWLAVKA